MNSHTSFQKTCLAALLLAASGAASPEPVAGSPVAQEPVQSQANLPAMPANQPVTATGPGDQDPVVPEAPESADSPETPSASAPAFTPESLHGQWTVREQHPDAGEVVTLFSINPDSSFAGTMTVAGNVVWSYSGNWYLDGNLITWFYTESTPPLMLVDETEVDEIIAVDSEKLIYRSGRRDVLETLYRNR